MLYGIFCRKIYPFLRIFATSHTILTHLISLHFSLLRENFWRILPPRYILTPPSAGSPYTWAGWEYFLSHSHPNKLFQGTFRTIVQLFQGTFWQNSYFFSLMLLNITVCKAGNKSYKPLEVAHHGIGYALRRRRGRRTGLPEQYVSQSKGQNSKHPTCAGSNLQVGCLFYRL